MSMEKEIINYINDCDNGIGLNTDPGDLVVVVSQNNIDEAFASITDNIIFVTKNIESYNSLLTKYPGLKIIEGDLTKTNLADRSACFIITTSEISEFNNEQVRVELKRISLNEWSDVLIIEDNIENKKLSQNFLDFFYAGSGYEYKEFSENGVSSCVYHNPIGYNESEIKAPAINEFLKVCENYCNVIENYKNYSVKDFLYSIQKCLVNYYSKGFDLPDCSGSNGNTEISTEYTKKNVDDFFKLSNKLLNFLERHNEYWSNFNPYPDDNDKETYVHSLTNDLAEIYEDIKSATEAF
jgi:hypothetical protein